MRDESSIINSLVEDAGLCEEEAFSYLNLLKKGKISKAKADKAILSLVEKGMVILSADNSSYVPTHPRLAVANQFRTWREKMVREINERRMRIDKLILELIPIYENVEEERRSGKM
jgi:predicted transcriptional regulator